MKTLRDFLTEDKHVLNESTSSAKDVKNAMLASYKKFDKLFSDLIDDINEELSKNDKFKDMELVYDHCSVDLRPSYPKGEAKAIFKFKNAGKFGLKKSIIEELNRTYKPFVFVIETKDIYSVIYVLK